MSSRRDPGTSNDAIERQTTSGGIELQIFSSSNGGITRPQSSGESSLAVPNDDRQGVGFRLTGYRLLTLSSLLGFSTAKAVQSFKNKSISTNSLDLAFGGGITFIIVILGYVQEDQKHRWPMLFAVDYWSLTLDAVKDMQFKDRILLKVTNILAYILFLSSNVYMIAGSERIYKESYFTPASWAQSIWYPIHFLLLGYVVYQFFPNGKQIIINDIGWRFPLLAAVASVYFILRSRQYSHIAWLFSVLMSSSVSEIYLMVMSYGRGNITASAEIFVQVPISLYHSITNILLILNGFDAFGINAHTEPAGTWTKSLVFVALVYLFVFATLANNGSSYKVDLAVSIANTWFVFAIFARQRSSPFIHWSALAFAVLSLFGIAKGLLEYMRSRRRQSMT